MPQQNIQGSGLGSLFAAALGSPAQDMRNQADAYRIRQQMDLAKQTADLKQREYEQSVLNDNRDYQLKQALKSGLRIGFAQVLVKPAKRPPVSSRKTHCLKVR